MGDSVAEFAATRLGLSGVREGEMVMTTEEMSLDQRRARLQEEIRLAVTRRGYRVVSQTETAAQLVKPKTFSASFALLWFLLFGVGILVYLLYYAAKRDKQVYLTINETG